MELWGSAVRMMASLALVLALILGLLALAKTMIGRRWLMPPGTSLIRVLGSSYVGPRKHVLLVAVAQEVLILGTTATDLVPLGRITDPDQIKQVLSQAERGGPPLGPASAFMGHVGEHGVG
ncbi:MAG TPA: flagellar biosynthetic protein FliO [Nitrospiraceae bacterium]|nr:flagellar biosynthetic protein FliO [Nitrospiraceae bacterium]